MFSVLFLAIGKLCLKWAEFCHLSRSFVNKGLLFLFRFVNQTNQHLLFQQEVFRKVLFVFWTKYIWHKTFRKKELIFFPWAKTEDFVVYQFSKIVSLFFHRCSTLATSLKVSTKFSTKKHQPKLLMITGCLKNNHFSITNITRWVGLQKKLNC